MNRKRILSLKWSLKERLTSLSGFPQQFKNYNEHKMFSYKKILLLAFVFVSLFACEDEWEEHNKPINAALQENIMQQVSENPRLSQFTAYLKETGYNKVLTTSKSFTVWAPTNEALQNLDQEIVKDPERLKQFVANHISYQHYFTHTAQKDSSHIQTLSGKYIAFDRSASQIDGVDIEEADAYAGNGVLHVIKGPLTPKKNSWEFMSSSGLSQKQTAFMLSLLDEIFVDSLANQIGVDPDTGDPVYDSLQGMVELNRFSLEAYNISAEDSMNTFIMLTDEAFESELNKFRQYYQTGSADSTDFFTALAVVKDLSFKGIYRPENLPDTLISKSDVKVHIDKSAIVQVEKTSNGIVYVLNNLKVSPKDKLKPLRIEGESIYYRRHLSLSHPDKANRVHLRTRRDQNNEIFTDILAQNHDISGFHIKYSAPNVNATTYKVYWVAYNDFNYVGGTVEPFQQRLAFKTPDASELPYTEVAPFNLNKVLLGEYTVDQYGDLEIYLVGAQSTRDAVNPLILDYIEMVPVNK